MHWNVHPPVFPFGACQSRLLVTRRRFPSSLDRRPRGTHTGPAAIPIVDASVRRDEASIRRGRVRMPRNEAKTSRSTAPTSLGCNDEFDKFR